MEFKQIVFIHIAGPNKIPLWFFQKLKQYDATVLDIEHALTHDYFSFAMLVALSPGPSGASFLADLKEVCGTDLLQVLPITMEDYNAWVKQGKHPKQIITLLGHTISTHALAQLFDTIQRYDLGFDRMTRLSGRVPLNLQDETGMVLEMVVFDAQKHREQTAFHADILNTGRTLGLDIAVQEDTAWRHHRRLVCFDMDATLIETEVIDELAKLAGVVEQVQKITEAAMRGEMDYVAGFHARMALLQGIPESALQALAERLPITPGAEKLLRILKKLGFKTAILSGGFDYFARIVQQRLGIDTVYTNILDVQSGKTTGKVLGDIVDGKYKAAKLVEIAKNLGIALEQVVAIGDGANDIPMLSIAGLGIAFQAKPLVREKTKQHLTHFGIEGVLYLLGLKDEHINP